MQHIRHPNTLLFIGVSFGGDDGKRFFIITEFAPLGDLADLLKVRARDAMHRRSNHLVHQSRGSELTWSCKIKMAEEIARGLAYLHDRGVFHRCECISRPSILLGQLTPSLQGSQGAPLLLPHCPLRPLAHCMQCENVLVFPGDNDGLLMKVADFGLGFLSDMQAEKPTLIRIPGVEQADSWTLPHIPAHRADLTSSQVGTVWIRAPEVDSLEQYSASAVDGESSHSSCAGNYAHTCSVI